MASRLRLPAAPGTRVDEYLPVPNLQKPAGGAEAFCHWAAERKGIRLPTGLDYAAFLAQGKRRFGDVARMGAGAPPVSPPLEVWLLLDRALFLEEQGYQVEVGTFCPNP